jgi:ribosomal protein L34E
MPQPHFRTRSRKRQKVKSSDGSNLTSYEKEKTTAPSSLICGEPQVGLPQFTQTTTYKLNRSKKESGAPAAGKCATTASKAY